MPDEPPKEKHDHGPLIFPKDFLWGAATSAHQVEGNNIYSDWWDFELKYQPPNLRSGATCDQYNRYEEDFDLAKSLGHNSHRLSIEWARIEPVEGVFNEGEIDHYIKVLKALKERNFTVMLTLWHFTIPKWLSDKGGFENGASVKYFMRFAKKVIPALSPFVDFWVTVNEPTVYAYMAYLAGIWPPKKISKISSGFVMWNLARIHRKTYKLIHKLSPGSKVGIAHNVQSFESYHKHSFSEQLAVEFGDITSNHLFYILTKKTHDFLGINYYFHHRFKRLSGLIPEMANVEEEYRDVSDLGWEVFPEGIYDVLADLSDHIPIYITECGIASTNDDRRTRFLIQYLHEVYRAIKSDIRVQGFFYWSLIDNFEWHQGFGPRFGLVRVDYETQKRTIRPSAWVYSEIIRQNGIPHSLLRLLGHTVRVEEVLCYQHQGPRAFCEHLPPS